MRIALHGLTKVRVDAGKGSIQAGDRLTVGASTGGTLRAASSEAPVEEPTAAIALEPASGGEELIWACFSVADRWRLDGAVSQHRVGHLLEAGDVGAVDVVDVVAFVAVLDAALVDVRHDLPQPLVDFLTRPGDTQCIL